jgi:6-pyruvoyltetrahydropterin/6-carboxytetrahydropterin synthase
MDASFRVRVEKDELTFSAAHFITFDSGLCERLHGHNYRVSAEVSGPLGPGQYVIDFLVLRDALREIVAGLDHYVLLPTEHPGLRLHTDEQSVQAALGDRRWVFPRSDCLLLPLANTTAEKLAEYIGHRLLESLRQRGAARPAMVRIEIDECYGQVGVCELTCT